MDAGSRSGSAEQLEQQQVHFEGSGRWCGLTEVHGEGVLLWKGKEQQGPGPHAESRESQMVDPSHDIFEAVDDSDTVSALEASRYGCVDAGLDSRGETSHVALRQVG